MIYVETSYYGVSFFMSYYGVSFLFGVLSDKPSYIYFVSIVSFVCMFS